MSERRTELTKEEVAAKVQERKTKTAAKAKSDKLKFWGGGLLGIVSAGIAVFGTIAHDDVQMIAGLVFGAVAFKIIPFSEAVKLWPFGRDKGE